jgi:DNA-directed RNA polymerase subunit RPC12/RpoP
MSTPPSPSAQTSAQRWNRYVDDRPKPSRSAKPSPPTIVPYRAYVRKQPPSGFFDGMKSGWDAGWSALNPNWEWHALSERSAHDSRSVRDTRTAQGIARGYPAQYVCRKCVKDMNMKTTELGEEATDVTRCPECSEMVKSDARFCSRCGHNFTRNRRR